MVVMGQVENLSDAYSNIRDEIERLTTPQQPAMPLTGSSSEYGYACDDEQATAQSGGEARPEVYVVIERARSH